MESIEELYDWIDRSEYVRKVEFGGEIIGLITFNGGHTLNFYNVEGKGTDTRSIGDFSKDGTELEEAKKEIEAWIEEMQEEFNLDNVE